MMFLDEDDPRRRVWEQCESPIEKILCTGIFTLLGCKAVNGPYDQSRRSELADIAGETPAAFLFSQHWIGNYRADFLVVLIDPIKRVSSRFIIECDGADYHSADEHVARDEARDAEIVAAGYKFVARYSGTAIHRSVDGITGGIRSVLHEFGVTTTEEPFAHFYRVFTKSWADENRQRAEQRKQYWREELASTEEIDVP